MFIGLDLGTSGLKAVLIGADQRILAEASAALQVQRPADGWVEQDPQSWLDGCDAVLTALAARSDLAGVKAIGLSGQMHGATLLDARDQPLRPAILWNDTRAAKEAAALDADPLFRAQTGNIVFPGFTAPKLAWVATHEPAIFAQIARVLLPKDYLRLWLTGEAVSDMSDAAGTSWLDVGRRDWSDALLAKTGLSRSVMPRLVEGSAVTGNLRPALAQRWGLSASVAVAGGGGDNAAGAIGVGVVSEGDGFVSLGTSGVLFAAAEAYRAAPATAVHSFCHAVPGRWHQMGVVLAAADALNWWARAAGRDAADLTQALGPLRAPSRRLFLPYLGGERTPHNDAHVRGAFLHLDHDSDQMALARTVLEGVSFAVRDCFDALQATGTQIDRLIAIGGGAQSDYWLRAIATVLDRPVDVPVAGAYGAAFGAARLGMMAATGAGVEIATKPQMAREVLPDRSLVPAFAEAQLRYRAAYAALKDLS